MANSYYRIDKFCIGSSIYWSLTQYLFLPNTNFFILICPVISECLPTTPRTESLGTASLKTLFGSFPLVVPAIPSGPRVGVEGLICARDVCGDGFDTRDGIELMLG